MWTLVNTRDYFIEPVNVCDSDIIYFSDAVRGWAIGVAYAEDMAGMQVGMKSFVLSQENAQIWTREQRESVDNRITKVYLETTTVLWLLYRTTCISQQPS